MSNKEEWRDEEIAPGVHVVHGAAPKAGTKLTPEYLFKSLQRLKYGYDPKERIAGLESRVSQLEGVGQRLLEEYEKEEEEHGFPFNFGLRDAHRELRAALSSKAPEKEE